MVGGCALRCSAQTAGVSFPAAAGKAAVAGTGFDGWQMVLRSNDTSDEPRMQINDTMLSQPVSAVAYEGEVKYGPRAEPCWNGDPTKANAYSRMHYNQMYVGQILERMEKTAPVGADLRSWRY